MQNVITILLSGGIDSSACVEYYKARNFTVDALFVDYGQLAAKYELKSANSISSYYNIPLVNVTCNGLLKHSKGYIPARNSFLLNIAFMNFKHKQGIISLGIHNGTNYYDCSEEFVKKMQELFNCYADGQIQIEAPFIKFNKKEIWDFSLQNNVPTDLTYSCEMGTSTPCGNCLSCKDREAIYASSKKHH